jgi:hypothetical protein
MHDLTAVGLGNPRREEGCLMYFSFSDVVMFAMFVIAILTFTMKKK